MPLAVQYVLLSLFVLLVHFIETLGFERMQLFGSKFEKVVVNASGIFLTLFDYLMILKISRSLLGLSSRVLVFYIPSLWPFLCCVHQPERNN